MQNIVRLSAGANVPEPRVDLVRSDDGTYTFTCSSGELRFLGSRALDASSQPAGHRQRASRISSG